MFKKIILLQLISLLNLSAMEMPERDDSKKRPHSEESSFFLDLNAMPEEASEVAENHENVTINYSASKNNIKKNKKQNYNPTVQCQICGKSLKKFSLKNHIIGHQTNKPFKCTIENCEKSFVQKGHLEFHIETHVGTSLICNFEDCGQKFGHKANLNSHQKKVHNILPAKRQKKDKNSESILCKHPDCHQKFATISECEEHEISHILEMCEGEIISPEDFNNFTLQKIKSILPKTIRNTIKTDVKDLSTLINHDTTIPKPFANKIVSLVEPYFQIKETVDLENDNTSFNHGKNSKFNNYHVFKEYVKRLIKNGTTIQQNVYTVTKNILPKLGYLDEKNRNALHYAALNGNLELIDLCLECKIDLYSTDTVGNTALHLAAGNGKLAALKKLVESGFKIVSVQNKNQITPLTAAAISGSSNTYNYLISIGANKNELEIKNFMGRTPLLAAADNCSISTITNLINFGANLRAIDNNGDSILHIAAKENRTEILDFFIQYKSSAFINFAVAVLLRTNNNEGHFPLASAILKGNIDAAKKIVDLLPKKQTI